MGPGKVFWWWPLQTNNCRFGLLLCCLAALLPKTLALAGGAGWACRHGGNALAAGLVLESINFAGADKNSILDASLSESMSTAPFVCCFFFLVEPCYSLLPWFILIKWRGVVHKELVSTGQNAHLAKRIRNGFAYKSISIWLRNTEKTNSLSGVFKQKLWGLWVLWGLYLF